MRQAGGAVLPWWGNRGTEVSAGRSKGRVLPFHEGHVTSPIFRPECAYGGVPRDPRGMADLAIALSFSSIQEEYLLVLQESG